MATRPRCEIVQNSSMQFKKTGYENRKAFKNFLLQLHFTLGLHRKYEVEYGCLIDVQKVGKNLLWQRTKIYCDILCCHSCHIAVNRERTSTGAREDYLL